MYLGSNSPFELLYNVEVKATGALKVALPSWTFAGSVLPLPSYSEIKNTINTYIAMTLN